MFKKLIPNMDSNSIDLLIKLLDFNIQNRITCKQALNHSYFKCNQLIQNDLEISRECASMTLKTNESINEDEKVLASLPDISNIFQPNILKRKRLNQIN